MMSKSTGKKTWRICDDVIDPIASKLWEIVAQWNRVGVEPPSPEIIDRLYAKHDVEFAITWLKLNISVDFANDFRNALFGPLQRFHKLNFRCLQILDGDMVGISKNATGRRHAIKRVIDNRYAELQATLPHVEDFDPDEDAILGEIENWYTEVEHGFRDTVRYLKQTSAILHAKLSKQDLRRGDVEGTHDGFIDSNDVANLVGLKKRTIESYRKEWPSPDIPSQGRSTAKWYYQRLLPKLKEQFPLIELPESWK